MDRWVKVTNASCVCHGDGVIFRQGLNIYPRWNPNPFGGGGIFFARLRHIHHWLCECGEDEGATLLWDVDVRQDAKFRDFGHRAKAQCIVLSNPRRISEDVYLAAVEHSVRNFKYVPRNKRSEAMCLAAVQRDPTMLAEVPPLGCTEAVVLAAVRQQGSLVGMAPGEVCTHAVCMAAVQQCGSALGDVPASKRTAAVCHAAVHQWGGALEHVPTALRTEALCLQAVRDMGRVLKYVPEGVCTEEICLTAVQQCGGALPFVPENSESCTRRFTAPITDMPCLVFLSQTTRLINTSLQ